MERRIHVSHYKNFDFRLLPEPYYEICNLQNMEIKTKFKDFIPEDDSQPVSNQNLSELKILYRSWKSNNFSFMYGLFHYRRFLLMQSSDLKNITKSEFFWHGQFKLDWKYRYEFAKENIRKFEELDGKLLVPIQRDVSDYNQKNIYNDFLGAHPDLKEELDRAVSVHEGLSKDNEFKNSLFNSRKILHFNIFYGPGNFAQELANYIFPTLEKLGKEFGNKYRDENIRWAGFIGERLFSHFVLKAIDDNRIEVIYKPVIYFDNLE
jgi:hypothetical protein